MEYEAYSLLAVTTIGYVSNKLINHRQNKLMEDYINKFMVHIERITGLIKMINKINIQPNKK